MKKIRNIIIIAICAIALSACSGCFLTFDGPGGNSLDQDAQDAQFDHMIQ